METMHVTHSVSSYLRGHQRSLLAELKSTAAAETA
jgi:hypothetical protein